MILINEKSLIFLLLFPFLVFSQEISNNDNSLITGESPYDSYFGSGVYIDTFYNELTIKNSELTDVVVCLKNVDLGATIRNEYITKGDFFTMKNIPNGVYVIKVFYGNNWSPDKLLSSKVQGAFERDIQFSISDNISDYILMYQYVNKYEKDVLDGKEIISERNWSTYTITLYTVLDGNMKQRPINVDEFFD